MKLATLGLSLILCLPAITGNAQSPRESYINKHKDDAIRDMLRTGVPASITLAQACLESSDGRSALATKANNHFGIKCSDWKGATFIQDDDKKDECFRAYASTLESYDDHSNFLRTRGRYSFLFELDPTDYKAWAKGLKKAGYATDPHYAHRLIQIIEDNQLYLLDRINNAPLASVDQPVAIPEAERPKPNRIYVPSVEPIDAFETRKVQSLNGIEYIIARRGDTFQSLTREFQLGHWQLPKYNEMRGNDPLKEGQIVFLQPKKKDGMVDVYTVKPGDTVTSIAQSNGMKSKYILKYNNLSEGSRLEPGQQLTLSR